jgi:hypothetical protein
MPSFSGCQSCIPKMEIASFSEFMVSSYQTTFIYCLFNDAVSISDCTALNVMMTNELGRTRRKSAHGVIWIIIPAFEW